MATQEKVDIELSGNHFKDSLSREKNKNQAEMSEHTVNFYIEEREKRSLIDELKKGYEEMGDINLSICEEFFVSEAEVCCDN